MWRFVSIAAPAEPISLADAQMQCNLLLDETEFDNKLSALIAAARGFVEKMCGIWFGERVATLECDAWQDMCRLPVAPVGVVTSIGYVDPDGGAQTVSGASYEMVWHDEDGIEPAIVPVFGASWPTIQTGSRITLSVTAGFAETPAPVRHAMLMLIAFWFMNRETVNIGNISTNLDFTVDALLCNYRRGI